MQFKSFTFRAEWLEAANALNDESLKSELLLAITTYGISGQYKPSSSPVVNALMTIIKAQIDATPSRRKQMKSAAADTPVMSSTQGVDIVETLERTDLQPLVDSRHHNSLNHSTYDAFREQCDKHGVTFTEPRQCINAFADFLSSNAHTDHYERYQLFKRLQQELQQDNSP